MDPGSGETAEAEEPDGAVPEDSSEEEKQKEAPPLQEREAAAFDDTGASPRTARDEEGAQDEAPGVASGEGEESAPAGSPAAEAEERREELGFYASVRLVGGTDTQQVAVQDNTSRFGLFGSREFAAAWGVYARSELGIDFVDKFDRILNPKTNAPEGANNVFLRVGYLGLFGPYGRLAIGKQWSPYYAVAIFTDRFPFSGGLASAAFNAATDGGATGTGRSSGALLYTLDRGGLGLRLQSQPAGREVPSTEGLTYGWSAAGSLLYEWDWGLELGAGFNHAPVEKAPVGFGLSGIDGPAQAWIVGLKVHRGPVYLAVTYIEHRNHDTDDERRYFDGRGVELLLRYAWTERFRLSAGLNHVEPFRRRPGSQYDIRTGLFSLEYSFRDSAFRNVLYGQVLLEGSHQADGTPYSNVYVVGGRYSFDF